MLIVLWGLENDSPTAEILEQLHLMNAPTKLIDQRRVLETEVELVAGKTIEGYVRIGNDTIDLAEITAAYVRPYESVRLAKIAAAGPESAEWHHAAQVDDILASWTELTSALMVNRCSAMAANGSKPYQLKQIRSCGWSVPETLITNDPQAARDFWNRHGEVIYKSVSGVRSRVSRLRPEHADRLSDLTACPTQFQQYLAGVDYRVHAIGDEVFSSEVHCGADDYRYATDEPPEIVACSLAPELEEKCRNMADAMGLAIAGIDLRRTPQGEWFCFEVNPSPGFTYYEASTGQPISRAVASLLANAQPLKSATQPKASWFDTAGHGAKLLRS